MSNHQGEVRNVIIIGGGPSGLAAALYNGRAGLKPVVFAGSPPGGQLTLTTEVENFPGIPSIMGPELIETMRKQVSAFDVEIRDRNVASLDLNSYPFTVTPAGSEAPVKARSIIVATGAKALWLGIDDEEKYRGKGVSACATCDGFFFRGKEVAIVGGGDTAMEDALTLTRFATKVYVIHRRDSFRASKIMQKRVLENDKIEVIWNASVTGIAGNPTVERLTIESTVDGSTRELTVQGLFVAIGHKPDTGLVQDMVLTDAKGYILTSQMAAYHHALQSDLGITTQQLAKFPLEYQTATSVHGVFAAGDCVDYIYRQASTAAGLGVAASIDAERWLENNH